MGNSSASPEDGAASSIETIISVDPGRAKCGVAVVGGPHPICCHHKSVVDSLRLVIEISDLLQRFPQVSRILVGSGTGSAILRRAIRDRFTEIPVEVVDEYRSSERARTRFLGENQPAGWQRLIPPSLRSPNQPYDDYVAIILAEEYFSKNNSNNP